MSDAGVPSQGEPHPLSPHEDVLRELQDDLEIALERVSCLRQALRSPSGKAAHPKEPS
jgi:hypothetical protein